MIVKVMMMMTGIEDLKFHMGSRAECELVISHVFRVFGLLQRKGKSIGKCILDLAVLQPVIFCMESSLLKDVIGSETHIWPKLSLFGIHIFCHSMNDNQETSHSSLS